MITDTTRVESETGSDGNKKVTQGSPQHTNRYNHTTPE